MIVKHLSKSFILQVKKRILLCRVFAEKYSRTKCDIGDPPKEPGIKLSFSYLFKILQLEIHLPLRKQNRY
jgi:hypothetical protein